MGTRVTNFANGPLPEQFEAFAYFTPDRTEWALPRDAALAYLDWCEGQKLCVLGWEAWYPTSSGPAVVSGSFFNQSGIALNRAALLREAGRNMWGEIVFNITVQT